VNSDPYGEGWMLRMRVAGSADRDQLLGPEEYAAHIGQ
jgi:glycine cleavage system H lipoate-binding protein